MAADNPRIAVIDAIASEGRCCLLLDAAGDGAREAVGRLAKEAFARGAQRVFFAVRDAKCAFPPEGFSADGVAFSFFQDALTYEKALPGATLRAPTLRLKARTASNAPLFDDLYAEAFFDQPLAAVPDASLAAGFFVEGGAPCGVYALDASGETGYVAALGIVPALRGQGYGRRALEALETRLQAAGCRRARLTVLSGNLAALGLYAAEGYAPTGEARRWYVAKRG